LRLVLRQLAAAPREMVRRSKLRQAKAVASYRTPKNLARLVKIRRENLIELF
jgi:hypothetical protein